MSCMNSRSKWARSVIVIFSIRDVTEETAALNGKRREQSSFSMIDGLPSELPWLLLVLELDIGCLLLGIRD